MHELIIQVINFVLLVGILFYYLKKPTVRAVASRQAAIRKEVEEARLARFEAERKFREFEGKLQSFEAEAKGILDKARKDADEFRASAREAARKAADRIVKDSEQATAGALDDTMAEIRREVIGKAIVLAERTVRERLSREDQKRILSEYVGKVE